MENKNQSLFLKINKAMRDNTVLAIKLILENPGIEQVTYHYANLYANLLSNACSYGNLEVISILLEKGSSLNEGCIHSAIRGEMSFEHFEEIMDLLLYKVEDISDINTKLTLEYAYKFVVNMDKKVKIIKYLIDKGLKFENDSILNDVVSNPNNLPLVQLLIEKVYHVNFSYQDQFSILTTACKTRNNHDIIEYLLENDANPNLPLLNSQMSPLFIAVYKKNQEARTVELLLEKGAEINFRTPYIWKPNALFSRNQIMPYWMKEGTPLMAACVEENNEATVEVLLKRPYIKLDPEPSQSHYLTKATALTNACELNNNDNVIIMLLEKGAIVEPRTLPTWKMPPLLQAIHKGCSHTVVVKFIEKGAKVNLKYLHICYTRNDILTGDNKDIVEIFKIIIDKLKKDGVDINSYYDGTTILYGLINGICGIVRNNIGYTRREPVIFRTDKLLEIINLLIVNDAFILHGNSYGISILDLLSEIIKFINDTVIQRNEQVTRSLRLRTANRTHEELDKETNLQIAIIQDEVEPYYTILEHIQQLLESILYDSVERPINVQSDSYTRHVAFDIPRIPETIMCVIICAYRLKIKHFPDTEEVEEVEEVEDNTALEEVIPLDLLFYIMSCIEYNQFGRIEPPMIEEIEDDEDGSGGGRSYRYNSSYNERVGGAKRIQKSVKKSHNIYLTKKYKKLRDFIIDCYKNIQGSNLEEKEKTLNKLIDITEKEQNKLKLVVKLDPGMLFDLRYFGELNHKISKYIIKNNILKTNIPKTVTRKLEKLVKRKSPKRQSVKNKTVRKQSAKSKTVRKQSAKRKSPKNKTLRRQSIKNRTARSSYA